MLKLYTVQSKERGNAVIFTHWRKKRVLEWAKDYLIFNNENLVCLIWRNGKEIDGFNITKRTFAE